MNDSSNFLITATFVERAYRLQLQSKKAKQKGGIVVRTVPDVVTVSQLNTLQGFIPYFTIGSTCINYILIRNMPMCCWIVLKSWPLYQMWIKEGRHIHRLGWKWTLGNYARLIWYESHQSVSSLVLLCCQFQQKLIVVMNQKMQQ